MDMISLEVTKTPRILILCNWQYQHGDSPYLRSRRNTYATYFRSQNTVWKETL